MDASRDNTSKMPLSALNALPAWIAPVFGSGALRNRPDAIELGRYVTVICALHLAWVVFRWSRELYGPAAGLLALTLFVFDPNILAHAGLVTGDLYAAWMITLAVWTFSRLLRHEGPGQWRVATIAAVTFGLAQLAKYTCAYLAPILVLSAAGYAAPGLWALVRAGRFQAAAGRLVTAGKVGALFLVAFLVVVNVGFLGLGSLTPFRDHRFESSQFRAGQAMLGPMAGLPALLPAPYLDGLDWVLAEERRGANVYLLGQFGKDGVPGRRFPEYFAVAWLYKEPIATQILVLLAVVIGLIRVHRGDFHREEWPLACAILVFAGYFTFVYNYQIGFRYALVVHPLLFVFAGSLLRDPVKLYRGARIALGVLLIGLGASTVSYFPHFLAYFNEFVWDRTKAYRILVDSNLDWGQSRRYVRRYLRQHPDVYLDPPAPAPGTLLVSANHYTGLQHHERYRWLRENFEPVGHVGYAYLLFRITPEELRRVTDPVPPDHGDKFN